MEWTPFFIKYTGIPLMMVVSCFLEEWKINQSWGPRLESSSWPK